MWRKQASVSIQEEFEDRYLPAELEASLPPELDAWMTRTQLALRNAIEAFTQLTTLQERMLKRQEADCIDRARFSSEITLFTDAEASSFPVVGPENGQGITKGLQITSKYYSDTRQTITNENR